MKKLLTLASLLVLASLVLAACGGAATEAPEMTEAPAVTEAPVATEAPAATEAPVVENDLLAAILERGYILVSSDPNYEPYSFLNTEGTRPADTKCPDETLTGAELQGFDIDVALAVGEALGVETCFPTPSWDLITAGSWADKWDVSIGSMTITTARLEVLDFSVPYYYSPAVIAVSAASGIDSLESLAGQAVCAGTSTTYEFWLNGDLEGLGLPESSVYAAAPEGVSVVSLPTDQECAQAIEAGRTEFSAYATSEGVVDANIADGIPVVKLDGAIFSEELAAAFDKSSSLDTASLVEKADEIITALHTDGTLSELSIKWHGVDLTQAPE